MRTREDAQVWTHVHIVNVGGYTDTKTNTPTDTEHTARTHANANHRMHAHSHTHALQVDCEDALTCRKASVINVNLQTDKETDTKSSY